MHRFVTKPPGRGQPDSDLVNTLLETIQRHPPSIPARTILIEHWIEIGWLEEANGAVRELLRIQPRNKQAKSLLRTIEDIAIGVPNPNSRGVHAQPRNLARRTKPEVIGGRERGEMERELEQGCREIRRNARIILFGTESVNKSISLAIDDQIGHLKALTDGHISSVVTVQPPRSARAIARDMEADMDEALETATNDLTEVVTWRRSNGESLDSIREALAKRTQLLVAALPEILQQHPSTALMHVEREHLKRTYVNDETMYGDTIPDIPRPNFLVTEDGYAWDMEELAAALKSNSGVMRNPLSKQMFSVGDVQAIVSHPFGRVLVAQQEEQSRLFEGVRLATIEKLDELARILLADMDEDQAASRTAIDGFFSYMAVLPLLERNAVDKLQVPAIDSHTGQSFDCTVGEAVRDARANKICLHKAGDLIGQAARYLRQNIARDGTFP